MLSHLERILVRQLRGAYVAG